MIFEKPMSPAFVTGKTDTVLNTNQYYIVRYICD